MFPSRDLDDQKISELLNANVEHEHLDYKEIIDVVSTSGVVRIAKDMVAIANSGGGDIVIGVDNNFRKTGLPLSFKIDDADLRNKVNRYFSPTIRFIYKEVIRSIQGKKKKFAFIHIAAAEELILPIRDGNYQSNGKQKTEFRTGDIFIRDGSQSKRAGPNEIRRLFEKIAFKKRIVSQKRFVDSVNDILEAGSKPDKKKETLPSNLLPIKAVPNIIWGASTYYLHKKSVYEDLKDEEDIPNFILRNQQLFSFSNLNNAKNPLRQIIDVGSITSYQVQTWKDDVDKWRWIVELLNIHLRDHCSKKGLSYDRAHRRFYFSVSPFKTRKISWKTPKRRAVRQVTSYYESGGRGYYLHRTVRLRCITLGEQICLLVEPGIMFSENGRTPTSSERFQQLATRLTHDQYNALILNDVRFWATYLSNSRQGIIISDFDNKISIDTKPLGIQLVVGIKERSTRQEQKRISEEVQFDPEMLDEEFPEPSSLTENIFEE
jgi:hypothetical protein